MIHSQSCEELIDYNIMASNSGSGEEKLLLRNLVDASWNGDTAAVQRIVQSASWDVLNGSADVPRYLSSFTPLRAASHQGCLDIVQLLLQHGADVNITNTYGETALCTATLQDHGCVIHALLQHKHQSNLLDRALISASFAGRAEIARYLLQNSGVRANVYATDLHGRTPLQTAVQQGRYETARVLLEYGADPNDARNNEGTSTRTRGRQTLLHQVACRNSRGVRTLQALLEHGADQRIRGWQDKTALELACENDCTSAIYVLFQSGIGDGSITFF